MSRETTEWLNNNVMMGFIGDREKWATQQYASARTDDAGNTVVRPWFGDENYTGGYQGPVPVEAVMDRLFCWTAVEGPLYAEVPCSVHEADNMDAEGRATRKVLLPEHKAIMRSNNDFVMGVFKRGYKIHQYNEWLIDNVANIIDDDVQIDSAGLLMGGGVAWVSVSLPETLSTSAGFAIRPRILSFTSHNGKHSTTYMRSVNAPVCDNSLDVEIKGADRAQRIKIKHSAQSGSRIVDAREALGILYETAEDTTRFFERLTEWEVTDAQFAAIVDALEPLPEVELADGGKVKNQRKISMASTRRMTIANLYVRDHRAAPWRGSALGVLQAFNTYDQQVRGGLTGERVERQMLGTLAGDVATFDAKVLGVAAKVCDVEMEKLVAV